MDIRNFFGPIKGGFTPKPNKASQKPTPSVSSKSSKKRQIIDSDSDEDISIAESNSGKKSKYFDEKKTTPKKSPSASKTQPMKMSTPTSFFGSDPVERSTKKRPNRNDGPGTLEKNHENKDFLLTLMQLEENKKKLTLESNFKDKDFVATIAQLDEDEFLGTDSPHVTLKPGANLRKVREPRIPVKGIPASKKPKLYEMEMSLPLVKEKTAVKKVSVEKTTPEVKKKKNTGSANYMSYVNREGPRSLGSKEVPEGDDDCLEGLTFLVTGVLESFERDEVRDMILKFGGKFMSTLSKNINYIVVGRDAGPSKLEKAEKFGTNQLTEDGLLDLIRTRPGKQPKKKTVSPVKKVVSPVKKTDTPERTEVLPVKRTVSPEKIKVLPIKKTVEDKITGKKQNGGLTSKEEEEEYDSGFFSHSSSLETVDSLRLEIQANSKPTPVPTPVAPQSQMWVDKYKPTSLKQLIGQQGDKSNAYKLLKWLRGWDLKTRTKKPAYAGRWNTSDDGLSFKAALLSGPPGVGKTTTAQLVSKEAGFDYVELNASDTRSKKTLQQAVSELLLNQSLAGCFGGFAMGNVSKNHLIIMDEVDGMAGNEDRGGIQELIGLIKVSKVPIICICNDRNHIKMRSLGNHCFDLRFQRPRVEQIKAALMSIAFKEKIKVVPSVLQDIIVASNQDIRQAMHNLSLWTSKEKSLTSEQAKKDIGFGTKHVKMSPFDVLREVFAIGMKPGATINDKAQLFFHDYSIAPLFVQENYIHVNPQNSKGTIAHLDKLSAVAESLCIGDLIEKQIRSQSSWSLLPVQAIFSSVVPGTVMAGNLQQMINFPAWLGKNSNRNRMDRILQELQMHMRTRITGNKTEVSLEYLPLLQRALTKPLIQKELEGIQEALSVMEQYFLLREDFDSIVELSLWSNQTDPRTKIPTKVKSAFTRTYNKQCGQNPYAVSNFTKKRGKTGSEEGLLGDDELQSGDEEEDEENDKVENDAMIKVGKKPALKKNSANESEASSSKKISKPSSSRGRKKK